MMLSVRVRAAIFFLLATASFSLAILWRPHTALADSLPPIHLENVFPDHVPGWQLDLSSPPQIVSPDTQELLSQLYNQVLTRTYINGQGARIMLSVAYGGDQSDANKAHRPEVCYPAQGFQILFNATKTLDLQIGPLRVRHLVAQRGPRTEPISYWMMVGDKVTVSDSEQKISQLSYSTRGIRPDGMLIRVSSIADASEAESAFRLQEQFISALLSAIPTEARNRIAGPTVAFRSL